MSLYQHINHAELVSLVSDVLVSSTLIWKKDGRIISAGETIIRKDPRLHLVGYNLDINEVMEEDAGEYVCEIETYGDPLDQVHTVEVLGRRLF